MSTAALRLARLLADGELHSGATLAVRLGLTRAAVWSQVRELGKLGLSVERRRGRGYRLTEPLHLLDAAVIEADLRARGCRLHRVTVLDSVGSTNDALLAASGPAVCLAEHQSSGRGRRGRAWLSPYGVNLYLSAAWCYEDGAAGLHGLSLALGAGVAQVLRRSGVPVQLKWPNDLWLGRRKLGGLLVELTGDAQGPCRVVAGLGLNVNMTQPTDAPDQPWISLAQWSGRPFDRTALAVDLIEAVERTLAAFPQPGLAAFRSAWRELDALHGQAVSVEWAGERVTGVACGIDPQGGLEVRTPAGPRVLLGGDVSVRADAAAD